MARNGCRATAKAASVQGSPTAVLGKGVSPAKHSRSRRPRTSIVSSASPATSSSRSPRNSARRWEIARRWAVSSVGTSNSASGSTPSRSAITRAARSTTAAPDDKRPAASAASTAATPLAKRSAPARLRSVLQTARVPVLAGPQAKLVENSLGRFRRRQQTGRQLRPRRSLARPRQT